MDSLALSVEQTVKNLQEKKQFLQQQRDRYIHIRNQVVNSEGGQDEGNVMMYGDVIISPKRLFVNLGYEYYVEKRQDELLEYVDEKRKLIEQAIDQFESKIRDGEKAIQSFGSLYETEQSRSQSQIDELDGQLPSMEIREELDEDGNVISSTVMPTMGPSRGKQDSSEAQTGLDDFEQNLKGKLIENKTNQELEQGSGPSKPNSSQISTEDMYTFADLVRQMDEQDEIEDDVNTDEVNYNFDSFERIYETEDHEDEDEGENEEDSAFDDEDDSDDNQYMVAPTMEAHSAFMDQLRQLRQQKAGINKGEKSNPSVKSILKKNNDSKTKPKKSVGFAPTLDIHEVTNFKQDNLRNRHGLTVSMQPLEHNTEEEFDSDLFAQLIGARGPDEIHDRYKPEAEEQNADESMTVSGSTTRKARISRFKQERKDRDKEPAKQSDSCDARPTILSKEKQLERACSTDDVETFDAYRPLNSSPTVEINKDGSAMVDAVVEKDTESLADSHVVGNVENNNSTRNYAAASTSTVSSGQDRASSLLSKKLNSLQRTPKLGKPKNSEHVYEFSNSSESESDGASDSDELPAGSGSSSLSEAFPKEVMDKVHGKDPISMPNVDYTALGDNFDDMVKAYSLGIYDDDLDEDPGMLLEKIDDFEQYNKQVEDLKSEIETFKIENPIQEVNNDDESDEDGPLMTEIKENDVPQNYNTGDADEDLALEPSRLSESIAIEYSRLRQVIDAKNRNVQEISGDGGDEGKQLEPIDENGAPIRVSRFKSQRLNIRK